MPHNQKISHHLFFKPGILLASQFFKQLFLLLAFFSHFQLNFCTDTFPQIEWNHSLKIVITINHEQALVQAKA
jgi:hypothetical protein